MDPRSSIAGPSPTEREEADGDNNYRTHVMFGGVFADEATAEQDYQAVKDPAYDPDIRRWYPTAPR